MRGKELIGLLVGKLTKKGGRVFAEKVLLECLKELKEEYKIVNGLEVIAVSLEKISPLVEIKSRKVGGTVYRIPKDVSEQRGATIGIKWLLESVGENLGSKLPKRLVKELFQAYSGQGKAVERVREIHEFAKKNRGLVKFL